MDVARYLATIDGLRSRAFPARRVQAGPVLSGPGHHIAVLEVSEDFCESGLDRVEEVLDDFEAACQALVILLSERWGEPEVTDLMGHLEASAEGREPVEPLATLCGYVPEVYSWRADGRWIAVGVGQHDREFPIELLAAVADRDFMPGAVGRAPR